MVKIYHSLTVSKILQKTMHTYFSWYEGNYLLPICSYKTENQALYLQILESFHKCICQK